MRYKTAGDAGHESLSGSNRATGVMGRAIASLVLTSLLLVACGSGDDEAQPNKPTATSQVTSTTMLAPATTSIRTEAGAPRQPETSPPTAVLTAAELAQWERDAIAFADRYYGAWPDVDLTFAEFTDDATFYDPTSEDILVEGKRSIVGMWRPFFLVWPDIEVIRTGMFLSAEAAAYPVTLHKLWPPWSSEPPDHPPMEAIEVLRFEDSLATGLDIWYPEDTLEMTDSGCFAGARCTTELRALADRYIAAWSSQDPDLIAALYADDAVFVDSMFGLEAHGADAIGDLAHERFGPSGDINLAVAGLSAATKGPTTTESQSEMGLIVGANIHYRWTIDVAGVPTIVESLTTFDLGTRGTTFELDPEGLITWEVVFHHPGSLVEADLTS